MGLKNVRYWFIGTWRICIIDLSERIKSDPPRPNFTVTSKGVVLNQWGQWRRHDLLRGGTKLEIRPWGTNGGLQGRVQQLLDD